MFAVTSIRSFYYCWSCCCCCRLEAYADLVFSAFSLVNKTTLRICTRIKQNGLQVYTRASTFRCYPEREYESFTLVYNYFLCQLREKYMFVSMWMNVCFRRNNIFVWFVNSFVYARLSLSFYHYNNKTKPDWVKRITFCVIEWLTKRSGWW